MKNYKQLEREKEIRCMSDERLEYELSYMRDIRFKIFLAFLGSSYLFIMIDMVRSISAIHSVVGNLLLSVLKFPIAFFTDYTMIIIIANIVIYGLIDGGYIKYILAMLREKRRRNAIEESSTEE